jgi:hypothetical protein
MVPLIGFYLPAAMQYSVIPAAWSTMFISQLTRRARNVLSLIANKALGPSGALRCLALVLRHMSGPDFGCKKSLRIYNFDGFDTKVLRRGQRAHTE